MASSENHKLTLDEMERELQRCTRRANNTEEEKSELFRYCHITVEALIKMQEICKSEELDSLSLFAAEELYFIALKYGSNITYWISYVLKLLPQFLGSWLRFEYGPQQRSGEPILNVSKRYTPPMVQESVDRVYTEDMIRKLFKEVNDYIRRCKRFSSKVAVLNAHMSLQLSLKYKRFINFRLNKNDERICRFLYNKYRTAVIAVLKHAQAAASQYEEFERFASSSIYDMNGVNQEDQL